MSQHMQRAAAPALLLGAATAPNCGTIAAIPPFRRTYGGHAWTLRRAVTAHKSGGHMMSHKLCCGCSSTGLATAQQLRKEGITPPGLATRVHGLAVCGPRAHIQHPPAPAFACGAECLWSVVMLHAQQMLPVCMWRWICHTREN